MRIETLRPINTLKTAKAIIISIARDSQDLSSDDFMSNISGLRNLVIRPL